MPVISYTAWTVYLRNSNNLEQIRNMKTRGGIVLTLYFAYLKKEMNHLFPRWNKLNFLSYGIVEDSLVVKDIID